MLDGLILQIVLCAVCSVLACVCVVWFVVGITEKSIAWVIAVAVPLAVVLAVVLAVI
jgi:uncharacterized membrane protein